LWRGEDLDKIRGGHCLVNWRTCTRPRKLGGLGIKDLKKLDRALRIKWLWNHWDVKEIKDLGKIGYGLLTQWIDSCSSVLLWIHIGNGRSTPSWEARWLSGHSPKDLAPSLYEVARFKKRTVASEMNNDNWIRNLHQVSTPTQLEEFTLLSMALSGLQLNDQKDYFLEMVSK
jgi:hypothetical protein